MDPEVLWCVHFTDLVFLGSGQQFFCGAFLLKMYRLLISQGFLETFSPPSNLSFFFCFLCRPPKWTLSTHSVQAVGGRSVRLSVFSVSPTSRAPRVHSSIKDCAWFNWIFKRQLQITVKRQRQTISEATHVCLEDWSKEFLIQSPFQSFSEAVFSAHTLVRATRSS